MPLFRDEQPIIIAPGSETTLAQLGLPESFTPARLRIRSCMFPAEKDGEWEPYRIRKIEKVAAKKGAGIDAEVHGNDIDETAYEEDPVSEDNAVWPIQNGRIVDWSCFYGLMSHVYSTLNPPFHTPILLITQPCWTPKELEKITQFFFEKFKMPAFGIMDSAIATCYAYGIHTATVVDIGHQKADVTAISEFVIHQIGRSTALQNCGGQAITQRLLQLLSTKGFTLDMCEQLKRNPICEILAPGKPLPSQESNLDAPSTFEPETLTAEGDAISRRGTVTSLGDIAMVTEGDTADEKLQEESEGVLDVASIVAGGKMNEYLAKKEKEKAERAAAKKKGADLAAAGLKSARLVNAKREKNIFIYERNENSSLRKGATNGQDLLNGMEDLKEAPQAKQNNLNGDRPENVTTDITKSPTTSEVLSKQDGKIRREVEVGTERFLGASGGIVEKLADAIHRTISSVEDVTKRSELWDSLIIAGNGSKVKGFKEALMALLYSKYLISPSSATIFTSELPSSISTPLATGANTPQPQLLPHMPSGVNPLLLAATTAQNPHLHPISSLHTQNVHSSHGQTPTSIKVAKIPEYFPEWKEAGYDEAMFLGAQVAAKVLFVVDQGANKGYMTRTDFNDQGPSAILEYAL